MTVRDIGPRDRGARKSQGIRTVLDHLKAWIVRAPKPSTPNPWHLGQSLRNLHGERSSKVGSAIENWINPSLLATTIQNGAIENIAQKLLERKAKGIKVENLCHLSRYNMLASVPC
jgi:hypothetical protein